MIMQWESLREHTLKTDLVFRDADGVGEGAADEGGPSRQFLWLLMCAIHSSAPLLYDGVYKQVGHMIAVWYMGV